MPYPSSAFYYNLNKTAPPEQKTAQKTTTEQKTTEKKAATPRKTTENAAEQSFADLVCSVVRVPNPQHNVGGEPGESELARFICNWLDKRAIPHTCDMSWGVHACLTGSEGTGAPGVVLVAHLDSDHLHLPDVKGVRVDEKNSRLITKGQVGLDCKTGVAIALSVLERLLQNPAGAWNVHCLFTVGEESGQKGAIRAPIGTLLGGKVRYGIVIDRMTSGSNCPTDENFQPTRHLVTSYKGVPLLEGTHGSGNELIKQLSKAAGLSKLLPTIESPNCADAIELRGRWDAEIVAPALLKGLDGSKSLVGEEAKAVEELKAAVKQYVDTTSDLLKRMTKCKPDERVSSMNSHPRYTRYTAMRRVYEAIGHGGDSKPLPYDPKLAFSCVNLSYDYDDAWDVCDLEELERTARIVLGACVGLRGAA